MTKTVNHDATRNMQAREQLASAIQKEVTKWQLTQVEAAQRLGITQPRLNDLLQGRIEKFSLDALVMIAAQAGLKVQVQIQAASLTVGRPELGAPALSINKTRPSKRR